MPSKKTLILRTTIRCAACSMVVSDQLQDLSLFREDQDIGLEQLVDHACKPSVIESHDGTHVALIRWKISYELKRTP